jgi:hypothetical protein
MIIGYKLVDKYFVGKCGECENFFILLPLQIEN